MELALEERQVVKNWSGEKMFLVGIQVDHFLDVQSNLEYLLLQGESFGVMVHSLQFK